MIIKQVFCQAGLCKNEGFCVPDCDTEEGFRCQCTAGWEGRSCNLKVDIKFCCHIYLSLVVKTIQT